MLAGMSRNECESKGKRFALRNTILSRLPFNMMPEGRILERKVASQPRPGAEFR